MARASDERQATREKLAKLIKGIKFAMLTTIEPDGTLRSRPMTVQQGKFDGTLWFFTQAAGHLTADVAHDPRVNVGFADPDRNDYVSVSGKGRIVRDRAKMKELWNPAYRAWFPGGLDDPNIALLRVDVTRAEFWDAPSSAMAHLYGVAKAMVTGRVAKVGEHKKVEVRTAKRKGGATPDRWSSPAGEPVVRRRSQAAR